MGTLRTVLVRKLRDADTHGRFHRLLPARAGPGRGQCCDLHSKLMIVDDEWLRIGSANLSNRSMGLDTECDVAIEARGDARIGAGDPRVPQRAAGASISDVPVESGATARRQDGGSLSRGHRSARERERARCASTSGSTMCPRRCRRGERGGPRAAGLARYADRAVRAGDDDEAARARRGCCPPWCCSWRAAHRALAVHAARGVGRRGSRHRSGRRISRTRGGRRCSWCWPTRPRASCCFPAAHHAVRRRGFRAVARLRVCDCAGY